MSRAPRTTDGGDAGRLPVGAEPAYAPAEPAYAPAEPAYARPFPSVPAPGAASVSTASPRAASSVAPWRRAATPRIAAWLAEGIAPVRERRRAAAAVILGIACALVIGVLIARQPVAGVDVAAYWHAARSWLAGGDPYRPTGPWWPYVYAPWLLPLFVPWALLPWTVASTLWAGIMLGLLVASVAWAYRRRPLATAGAVLALSVPLGIALGSGNISLYLVLAIWATRWLDARSSGLVWALATAMKWIPGLFLVALKPGARRWGLLALGMAAVLSGLTWQQTLEQIQAVTAMGMPSLDPGRSLRLDHLVFLWAAIPWLWDAHPRSWPRRIARRIGGPGRLAGRVTGA